MHVYGAARAALSINAIGDALSNSAARSSLTDLYGRVVSTILPNGLHNLSALTG